MQGNSHAPVYGATFFEECDIGKVLGAYRCSLVGDQLGAAEKGHVVTIESSERSATPCLFEIHAGDARHDIDAQGRPAQRGHAVGLGKTTPLASKRRKSKLGQCFARASGVIECWLDKDVEILRGPRSTIRCQGVRSHDQEAHVVRVRQTDEFVPVERELHRRSQW